MSGFFYGTLMHPKILKCVIGNDGTHLQICPAVLLYADYPGIIPYSAGRVLFEADLDREACSVRGTMVTGLTASDMQLLDVFEGSEYTRDAVHVHPLAPLVDLARYEITPATTAAPLPPDAALADPVAVDTYVYRDMANLMRDIWDFDDFAACDNPDFTEVDRRQAAGRG
ncbi:hypothetical protein C8J57DRAFT_1290157 [Mycena rebaudengoi]|nr:hypothetical protein C8J57DRAFT_1290157 [Mycena rebaudengoi]